MLVGLVGRLSGSYFLEAVVLVLPDLLAVLVVNRPGNSLNIKTLYLYAI
jgi:hypothetical protein